MPCHPSTPPGRQALRGVAMVEAVIALPVVVLLLWAVVWTGNQMAHQQALERGARACAFRYALAGCSKYQGLPQACAKALSTERPDPGTRDAFEQAGEDTSDLDELADLPGAGPLFQKVFGKEAQAALTRATDRPALLGGGQVEQVATMRLLCNERPVKGEIADQLWARFVEF